MADKNQHGGKRTGAGRPPVEGKKVARSIKLSDAEWQTIKQKADQANKTISAYIRDKALE